MEFTEPSRCERFGLEPGSEVGDPVIVEPSEKECRIARPAHSLSPPRKGGRGP
jgi:hypothetical protein